MSKTIIITGASDGIGAAAARQLHKDGHTVVIRTDGLAIYSLPKDDPRFPW